MKTNMRKIFSAIASIAFASFALHADPQTDGKTPLKTSGDDRIIESSLHTLPKGCKFRPSDAVAVILVSQQRMIVRVPGKTLSYPVSTAKAGIGSEAGSGKTPPGWHKVKKRIGSNAQTGQLFVSRMMIKDAVRSEREWHNGSGDEVLSRIFWLEGLDPKLNKDPKGNFDSYLRHIYIHGTNQEMRLGNSVSHGCIRMGNRDIVELFNLAKPCANFYVLVTVGSPAVAASTGL